MQYVYIIVYNSTVISQEGYDSYDKAVGFMRTRSYSPQKVDTWNFRDSMGNLYTIKEIQVR